MFLLSTACNYNTDETHMVGVNGLCLAKFHHTWGMIKISFGFQYLTNHRSMNVNCYSNSNSDIISFNISVPNNQKISVNIFDSEGKNVISLNNIACRVGENKIEINKHKTGVAIGLDTYLYHISAGEMHKVGFIGYQL